MNTVVTRMLKMATFSTLILFAANGQASTVSGKVGYSNYPFHVAVGYKDHGYYKPRYYGHSRNHYYNPRYNRHHYNSKHYYKPKYYSRHHYRYDKRHYRHPAYRSQYYSHRFRPNHYNKRYYYKPNKHHYKKHYIHH